MKHRTDNTREIKDPPPALKKDGSSFYRSIIFPPGILSSDGGTCFKELPCNEILGRRTVFFFVPIEWNLDIIRGQTTGKISLL